jgi:predicted nucleic acid-binding Zn ribbon protein
VSMSDRLLTTDELLQEMRDMSDEAHVIVKSEQKKKRKKYYIFWGIVAIAVLHLLFLSIPLAIGVHHTVAIFGETRVLAIPYVAGTVPEREGHVIVLNRYDTEHIAVDDFVVIYGLLDTDYYWEVKITDFDQTAETASVTYDDFSSETISFDDIDGVYVKDANFLGVIMFVSSRVRGLFAAAAVYASLVFVYYILVIREMKIVKKEQVDEQAEKS